MVRGRPDPSSLAERWTGGTGLTVQEAGTAGSFSAVSCPQADGCVAVGDEVAQRWDGTRWASIARPGGDPAGLSCTAVTACTVVGVSNDTGYGHAYAKQYDGTGWSRASVPEPGRSRESILSGVSCLSAADCIATGSYVSRGYDGESLGERWNGTAWTRVTTPDESGTATDGLTAVSCPQASACVALGSYKASSGYTPGTLPLIETSRGVTWSAARDDPSAEGFLPGGISCVSTTMCMAVGSSGRGDGNPAWAGIWNGKRLVNEDPPAPTGQTAILTAVSCPTAAFCLAVGGEGNTSTIPLAYTWDGGQWSTVSLPGPASGELSSVSCTSATWCVAVESDGDALSWNGTAWTQQVLPAPTGASAVSCASPTSCVVVGASSGTAPLVPETDRWNGTGWTGQRMATLPAGSDFSQFLGVSCLSASACTAVGDYRTSGGGGGTAIQTWNGSA